MRSSLYRAFIFICLIACLPGGAGAGDSSHFWTELSDSGRIAKVQSLPDFVELAAKLSPAVVNISSEESEGPGPGANLEEDEPRPPRGKTPHNPFEEYSPRAKSLGSGFIVT